MLEVLPFVVTEAEDFTAILPALEPRQTESGKPTRSAGLLLPITKQCRAKFSGRLKAKSVWTPVMIT